MVYIYGLYDPDETLRYIGRANDPWGRLNAHWNDRDNRRKRQYYSPKNRWLRTLDEPPAMEILVIAEDAEVFRTENALIREVSRRWPGLLVNSAQNGNSPEWDATRKRAGERLSAYIAANPEARDIRSETARRNLAKPGQAAARADARWAKPGSRERARERARPGFGAEMREWWSKPESRERMAKRRSGQDFVHDPETYRAMKSAASLARWYGGMPDKPCRDCGTPAGVFDLGCENCRKRSRHPCWRKEGK